MKTITAVLLVAALGCKTNHKATQANAGTQASSPSSQEFTPQYIVGPHVVIYKTKADYNNLVPVELSDDKTAIVSYPDPQDVKTATGYAIPTSMNKGYLLDNRGIGKNAAFLKMTYEEYANLKTLPTITELYNMIVEKDPLTELCDCGNKIAFTDVKTQINQLIDGGKLRTTCKTIK
jgi:hypothetical protein